MSGHAIADALVIRWAPLPGTAQERFFDDDLADGNLLLRGGWSAGKTMSLTAKALKLSAINAPLRGIWTVPDYGHITDTILPMLEEVDADGHPWFLGPCGGLWTYHHTEHLLQWAGGGPIQFASAENAGSIAGPNMAWAAVDEPGAIGHDAWRNTVARVRHTRARLRQKVAAGTSEGLGWLSDLFGPDRDAHCHVYEMDTRDNTALMVANPHFIREIMATATEAEIAAYVEGKAVNLVGALAYPQFAAERHWVALDPPDQTIPLCVAFDFNVDPMVAVLGQQRPGPAGPEAHVLDAVVLHGGSTVDQTCDEILDRYPTWPAGLLVYGDATGQSRHVRSLRSNYDLIRDRLREAGPVTLRVPRANPPVARRLNSVNRLLQNALGQTRCYIHRTEPARHCRTRPVVSSLQRSQIKPGTHDLRKPGGEQVTHAGDALGYWLDFEWPAQRPQSYATAIRANQTAGVPQTVLALRERKALRRAEELRDGA